MSMSLVSPVVPYSLVSIVPSRRGRAYTGILEDPDYTYLGKYSTVI